MRGIRPGLILLVIQLFLVSSVAGKYLYERQTGPRVWTRATQFDPALPLRGRYLALQLLIDACGLPRDEDHAIRGYAGSQSYWLWHVSLTAANGTLVARVENQNSRRAVGTVTLMPGKPCDRASLSGEEVLFIPDRAHLPLPLQAGEELWVEVTLPPSGPPRPIQIAVSGAEGFHPLKLD